MKYLKSKKAFIALLFSWIILFSNSLPLFALEVNPKKETVLEKPDSTKIKSQELYDQNPKEEKKEAREPGSATNRSYNVIYYLISMLMKIKPLSRPK